MSRVLHLPLAAALGVLCAVLVACGGSDAKLIPGSDADELKSALSSLQEAVDARDCNAVETRIDQLRSDIENLPDAVSPKLRQRLKGEAEDKLIPEARRACDDAKTETIPTQTETQETQQTPPPEEPSPEPEPEPEPAPDPGPVEPTPDEEEPPVDPVVPEDPVVPGAGGTGTGDDTGGFGTEGDG